MAVVGAARHLDDLMRRQKALRAELLEAVAEWREAVARLPTLEQLPKIEPPSS
jgi:hypothetical protein